MKIGFDVTQAVKTRGRGIARYVRDLVAALPAACPELEPVLYVRGQRWWRRARIAELAPELERRWLGLPAWLSARDLAGFHGLGTHLPLASRCPRSFTLHDLRDFDGTAPPLDRHRPPPRGRRKWNTIRRASGIVCPSEHGRRRLLELCPWFAAEDVVAIPHGIDHERFRPADPARARAVARTYALDAPYLLQVGSFFAHKNLELSLTAFARSRARAEGFQLAFCGGGGPLDDLRARADRLGLTESVRWIDDVRDDDLPLLYSASAALLFPSRFEGFGFPVIEAMACGTPGVTSDATCLPEISASIWPAAGVDDSEAFAAALDRILFDADLRANTITRGLEHAAGFTWRACAERTGAFLRRLTTRSSAAPTRPCGRRR